MRPLSSGQERVHRAPELEEVARVLPARPPAAALPVLEDADEQERGVPRARGREAQAFGVGDRGDAPPAHEDGPPRDLARDAERGHGLDVASAVPPPAADGPRAARGPP